MMALAHAKWVGRAADGAIDPRAVARGTGHRKGLHKGVHGS